MCVIVIKEKQQSLPSEEMLHQCFTTNPHGCGFMYNYKRKVIIEKGFMNFEDFYSRVLDLHTKINLEIRSVVFHFRITTHGLTCKGNCHPFPITNDIKMIKKTKVECDNVAFCHNGIMSNFRPTTNKISDTQLFGMTMLHYFYQQDKDFYKNKTMQYALKILCNSKLCFLNSQGKIYCVGQFFDYKGYRCSNLNFVKYQKKSRAFNWDYYHYKDDLGDF